MTAPDPSDQQLARDASSTFITRHVRLLLIAGLMAVGCCGYWLTSQHPIPTGPIAERLRDQTWQFTGTGHTGAVNDLRLNGDGTLRFGGGMVGTWNVSDDRLDMSFSADPQYLDFTARIWAALHGDAKVAYRILELTADSIRIQPLTPHGEIDSNKKEQRLTLASP